MRDEDSPRDAYQSSMAASKLLSGDSLPPRKRLLVGLKQNGWSISCSPSPCASCFCESNSHAAVGAAETSATKTDHVDGSVAATGSTEVQKQVEEGCARCGGCENSAWRRLKKGGVYQRFCNSCVLLYSTNLYCPHCLGLYEDASNLEDRSVWIVCCKCGRSVHIACESENNSNKAPDPISYLCPSCSIPKSPSVGIFGSKEKLCIKNKGSPVNCMKWTGEGLVETPHESPHFRFHLSKKSCHEAVGLGLGQRSSISTSSGVSLACKSSYGTLPVSPQESAAAAKATACMAAKAAAAARAKATAKASIAAKAAARARAALEAVALAARAEERAREELSRRSGGFEMEGQASGRIQVTVATEWDAGENIDNGTALDDEELARQLHRVMNSSPRITRSATPSSKKIGIKTEVDTEVKGFARSSSCSSDEPPPFPKPQLTRPRTSIHKENKRWEPRFSNFECRKVEREKIENTLQSSTSEIAKDGRASGPQCRSSLSACIDNINSGAIMAQKLDAGIPPNSSKNDKTWCNVKTHFLCSTLSPIVCEDRTKVGYKIKKIADVTASEARNLSAEDSKAKQVGNVSAEGPKAMQLGYLPAEEVKAKKIGISERCIDACMKAEDGNGALRVIKGAKVNAEFCAGDMRVHNQVFTDQARVRNGGFQVEGAPEKKVGKLIDKQRVQNWRSVSKLLISVDGKRVLSDTRTLSFTQRSEGDNGKQSTARQNGVKNGHHLRLKSNIKRFRGESTDNQHSHSKGTVNRQEPNQSLLKRKVSAVEEIVSPVGSLCKVANHEDHLASRNTELLKSKNLAVFPNAMTLTTTSSSASAAFVTLSDRRSSRP